MLVDMIRVVNSKETMSLVIKVVNSRKANIIRILPSKTVPKRVQEKAFVGRKIGIRSSILRVAAFSGEVLKKTLDSKNSLLVSDGMVGVLSSMETAGL